MCIPYFRNHGFWLVTHELGLQNCRIFSREERRITDQTFPACRSESNTAMVNSKPQVSLSENSVPHCTQWLMIIIPIKWLFHWEYTLFSDKPKWTRMKLCVGFLPDFGTFTSLKHLETLNFRCVFWGIPRLIIRGHNGR